MDKQTLALIGAPTDIGAAHRGASMGPEALRVAGIETALRRLGYPVEDMGNLAGPANPNAAPVGGYRHLDETALGYPTAARSKQLKSISFAAAVE